VQDGDDEEDVDVRLVPADPGCLAVMW
jgi:hypothetical protein